jgi:molybdate transport system substrate-binding protein
MGITVGVTVAVTAVAIGAAACMPTPEPYAAASAAQTGSATTTLHIFAAASLSDAFNALGAGFTAAHPGAELVFNFGGSNQLATQIDQGAPADVFASANTTQMQRVIAGGRIENGAARTFVRNRLVVVLPSGNPAGLTTLADLAKPRVKIVFAAAEVPAGQYTLDFLAKAEADGSLGAGYKAAVLANVVSYEESVRSVLAKVALGEADAGIVYTSDAAVRAPAGAGDIEQIAIPAALNLEAEYPIAVLNDSAQAAQAQAFVDYVLGPQGQQVLARFGFLPADGQ